MVKCEVNACKKYPDHDIQIGKMTVRICTGHKKATRKLANECGMKMLKAIIDIQDEFVDAVAAIKGE